MNEASNRSSLSSTIGALAFVFLLSVPAPGYSNGCSAAGQFAVTIGAGAGRLTLSADGSALMSLILGHLFNEIGLNPLRSFKGTYRTGDSGGGQYAFTLDVVDPDGLKISIVGMVAFQGSVLLFQAATVPSFGPGLALRSDTLTGE